MIDEGYRLSTPPIVLTKERPPQPDIPRDNFKVLITQENSNATSCMRYVESNGRSYAVTYWNCTKDHEIIENRAYMVFKCSDCKMVTWIELENE